MNITRYTQKKDKNEGYIDMELNINYLKRKDKYYKNRTRLYNMAVVALFLTITICIGTIAWRIEKSVNYKYAYDKYMENTVRKMVKPEALKEEYRR